MKKLKHSSSIKWLKIEYAINWLLRPYATKKIIKDVYNYMIKNKIVENWSIGYSKTLKYKKQVFPLKKLIVDYVHEKIFIYESYYRTLLSGFDDRVCKFNMLDSCFLLFWKDKITIKEALVLSKNESNLENIYVIIYSKAKYFPYLLSGKSAGNVETLIYIYKVINKIIREQNKK